MFQCLSLQLERMRTRKFQAQYRLPTLSAAKASATKTKSMAGAAMQLDISAPLSTPSLLPSSLLLISYRQQISNTLHSRSASANARCKKRRRCSRPLHPFLPKLLLEEILHKSNTDPGYQATIFELPYTAAQVREIVAFDLTFSSQEDPTWPGKPLHQFWGTGRIARTRAGQPRLEFKACFGDDCIFEEIFVLSRRDGV